MSATGGMGREGRKLYARLSEMLTEKRKQNYSLLLPGQEEIFFCAYEFYLYVQAWPSG